MRSAVPNYLGKLNLKSASPGQRFRTYFQGWDEKWELETTKKDAIEATVDFSKYDSELLGALRDRQVRLAMEHPNDTLVQAGISEAPFVTGMGMEHPLENGFAFLDPYGLPYLPGSSVKGVVRRAAEELALFDPEASKWSLLTVWWLFGFDENSAFFPKKDEDPQRVPDVIVEERRRWRDAYSEAIHREDLDGASRFINASLPKDERKEQLQDLTGFLDALPQNMHLRRSIHLRGSICLWDVFPEPPNKRLRVDIMNPHYGHYYQKKKPPGDWGDPKPIFFLAMPPATRFRFILRLNPVQTLPLHLEQDWKSLMSKALEHAFSWLGFGAKTSLGYGLMRQDQSDGKQREELLEWERQEQEAIQKAKEEQERRRQFENLPEFDRFVYRLECEANEQQVNEAYQKKLDKCSSEEQLRLATALKQAYMRLGKWSGKQSEKQKTKVTKIKQILGEK